MFRLERHDVGLGEFDIGDAELRRLALRIGKAGEAEIDRQHARVGKAPRRVDRLLAGAAAGDQDAAATPAPRCRATGASGNTARRKAAMPGAGSIGCGRTQRG